MKKSVILSIVLISLLLVNINIINSETNNEIAYNKIGSEVYKSLENNEEVRVIVEIKEPDPQKGIFLKINKSDSEIEKEKQEIKEEIKQDVGKENIKHEFDNQISLEVSQEDLKKLNENSDVEKVSIVKKMHAFLQDSVPLINASLVWPLQISNINLTGIDETVCIVDTGVNFNHPDLIGKNKTCVVNCITENCVPNCSIGDDNGHGTHVAGIIGANGGINGVAIGINLIGVKVLDASGSGSSDDVYAGIDWCVDNSATYNISVISMSLGDCTNHSTYCNNDGSATHINAAAAKNISVVISAGNGPVGSCASSGITNTNGPSAPACVENATAIGAVSKSDVINYQRGSLFEIMAPGVSISSTKSTGGYESRSGTSMAAPHASGAFAIIRQGFRLLNNRIPTPIEIRNILNNTGKIIPDSGTGLNFPRINVYSAVISMDNISPNVTLISPENNAVNNSVNQTFSCNATDLKLTNVTFYLWNSTNNLVYNETKNIIEAFNSVVFNVTNLNYSDYKWNCLFYDANNNSAFAVSNFSLTIGFLNVQLISPSNNISINQNQSFNCSTTTSSSRILKNSTLYVWNSSNLLIYNTSKDISGITNSSVFNYNFTSEGNYSWNCRVFDNTSESAFAVSNFTISYDITTPNISSITSSVTSSSSTINWNTDENANSSINYGTGTSLGSFSSDSLFVTSHSVLISSLSGSITYYYNITSCDAAGNCITNGTNSFTTSASLIIQQSSGGGGGGGPGYNTYVPSNQQLSGGYTQNLNINDKIKFTFFDVNAGEHALTVNQIKQNSINITIKSKPINLLLGIGQSAKLNLTSANYYDLYVKLENIENSKAKLTIQTINEEIPKPSVTRNVVESPLNKTENTETNKNEIEGNINYLTGQLNKIETMIFMFVLISVIVFVIVMIKKNIHSKKIENAKGNYREIFNKHINPKNKVKRYK